MISSYLCSKSRSKSITATMAWCFCNRVKCIACFTIFLVLLFPVEYDTHELFCPLLSNVYQMPRVCFKTITWHMYIEMHHLRTFFSCVASCFSYNVMFIYKVFISLLVVCLKNRSEFVLINTDKQWSC